MTQQDVTPLSAEDKELINNLIGYYEKHYAVISKIRSVPNIADYLQSKSIYWGICTVSRDIFSQSINDADWNNYFKSLSSGKCCMRFWCQPPFEVIFFGGTKLEMLKSIEDRIITLKKCLELFGSKQK